MRRRRAWVLRREVFHPKAFLSEKRNVRLGLTARTSIIKVLENGESNARAIANLANLHYNVVVHHLRLLETEKVTVCKSDKRPFLWKLTGAGQQRLINLKER
jgi:predicted transcriptional regulator